MISFSKWSFPSIGQDVYVYDIFTKIVKTKTWDRLPLCTSAFRWAEHYYCFHGHNFTRFNPVSLEVSGTYPKDARSYFMKCENFGEFIKKRILERFILEVFLSDTYNLVCFPQVTEVITRLLNAAKSN